MDDVKITRIPFDELKRELDKLQTRAEETGEDLYVRLLVHEDEPRCGAGWLDGFDI